LVAVDTLTIPIDTLTSPFPSAVSYVESENSLYFLNSTTYQLNVYDLTTKDLAKKITFDRSGANGIPKGIAGCYVVQRDSIFLTNGFEIYFFDGSGALLKRYKVFDQKLDYSFQVFFNTKDAPIIVGDTLFCVAYPDMHSLDLNQFKHRASVFALNLKTGKGQCNSFYPDKYQTGLFGNNYTFTSIARFDNSGHKLICAYPADEYLYTDNGKQRFWAKSKYFASIEPASKIDDTSEGHTSFFVTSPSFGPIYFDRHQKIYFRVAELPRTQEEFVEKKWWKEKTVIIMDTELSVIGEVRINNDALNLYHCFATPQGFCISLDAETESQKQFVVFKIRKI
jgi:hypothetical protein